MIKIILKDGTEIPEEEVKEIVNNLEGLEDVIKYNPDMIDWDNLFDQKPKGAVEMRDGHYWQDENGERHWIDY